MPGAKSGDAVPGPRRFCRFSDGRPTSEGFSRLPADGMCLSAFVLLSPRGRPDEVLVGRVDPAGAWERIGALDPARVRLWAQAGQWMLPSCHLLFFESPHDAARRIVREQLDLADVDVGEPQVYSEAYAPARQPAEHRHWDLDFLFRGELPGPEAPRHPAWRELRYVRPSEMSRRAFTRSHDDILELAGFRFDDSAARRPA